MTRDEIRALLDAHVRWLRGESDGARADLRGADLRGAYLSAAVLSAAVLRDAVLRDADLSDADLSDADLSGADLSGADLSDADLSGADLSRADLDPIRNDIRCILDKSPAEVPSLLAALREGRIDGSTYSGECACLVGTLANARRCKPNAIPGITPDSSRPAERWFLALTPGVTPATSQIASITEQWVIEWGRDRGLDWAQEAQP